MAQAALLPALHRPDGAAAIKQDHVRIALESRSELAPLAEQLKQQGSTETEARQKTVAHMLGFVQSIPHQLLDSQSGRQGRAFKSAPGAGAESGRLRQQGDP